MSDITFKPKNGRILIKPEVKQTTTDSGLVLAQKSEEKPVIGYVVVGNKDYKFGNRILFSKFGFDEVEIDKETYYVVSTFNILGIF